MKTSASTIGGYDCPTCKGLGLVPSADILRVSEEIGDLLHRDRLYRPDVSKGQYYFSPGGVANIVSFMRSRFDVEGRSIACLTTPILALGLAMLGQAKRVVALDLDGQLLQRIKGLSRGKLETCTYDIQERLPARFRGKFDCFVIDPFCSPGHYRLCLSRALDLVGPEDARTGYIVMPPKIVNARPCPKPFKPGDKVPLSTVVMQYLFDSRLYVAEVRWALAAYYATPDESRDYTERWGGELSPLEFEEEYRFSDVIRVETTLLTKVLVDGADRVDAPVSYKERQGREESLVELPPRLSDDPECNLCIANCYKDRVRKTWPEAAGPDVERYVRPDLADALLRSKRIDDKRHVPKGEQCVAFVDNRRRAIVVLQGLTSRDIYNRLQARAKEKQPAPDRAWLARIVEDTIRRRYGEQLPGRMEDRVSECVEFAVKLIDKGFFKWDKIAG